MASASQTTEPKPLPLTRRYRREYSIWAGMHQRCRNKRAREYHYYGQRRIRVCRRWSGRNGFRHFIADVGPQPFARASVHRKDNDGHYTPRNVTWADAKTPRPDTCAPTASSSTGASA